MAERDPRTIPPETPVAEHETAGRVWPERGLPASYQQTGVRYHEGDQVGMGGSHESALENSERWARFGRTIDESDQDAPQANGPGGRSPFKNLTNGR